MKLNRKIITLPSNSRSNWYHEGVVTSNDRYTTIARIPNDVKSIEISHGFGLCLSVK